MWQGFPTIIIHMYRAWVSQFLMGLLIGSLHLFAAEAAAVCQVEVFVNDPNAKILVDGKDVGTLKNLPCKEVAQVVRIEAPGKIPFVRAIPELSDESALGVQWQVELQVAGPLTQQSLENSVQTGVFAKSESIDPAVMDELRMLRRIVEELRAERNKAEAPVVALSAELPAVSESGNSNVVLPILDQGSDQGEREGQSASEEPAPKDAVATAEKITAEVVVIRDTPIRELPVELVALQERTMDSQANREPAGMADVQGALQGFYVLLHALKEAHFNREDALAELKNVSSSLSGKFFKFCRFSTTRGKFNPNWVKVFLGPFSTQQDAAVVSDNVGRGTFVVENPECKSRPWPDAGAAE